MAGAKPGGGPKYSNDRDRGTVRRARFEAGGGSRAGLGSVRPGTDDPERTQLHPAAGCAAIPVADPRPGGGRLGPAGAGDLRVHRLGRRPDRPPDEPDHPARPDARPGRGPALHLRDGPRPGVARHHPVVAGDRAAAAGPAAHLHPAGPAPPRLQRAAGALPRQVGDLLPAVRVPAAPAGRRRQYPEHAGPGVRLGVRDLGHRSVLLGRRSVLRATASPHPDGETDQWAKPGRS